MRPGRRGRRLLTVPAMSLPLACRDAPPVREFDGASAVHYLETQAKFGPRISGTEPHSRMAAWLDSLLQQRRTRRLSSAGIT